MTASVNRRGGVDGAPRQREVNLTGDPASAIQAMSFSHATQDLLDAIRPSLSFLQWRARQLRARNAPTVRQVLSPAPECRAAG
ncbi:hypothetical protein WME75_01200 [Sorangium sp. So ce1014]|uniref:hypothetical protein n=1 Tax=Sorangium sp. So ce1014 TaxID=3133326 RepID=UPI003F5F9CEE